MILQDICTYLNGLLPFDNKVIVIENTNFNKINDSDNLIVVGELASNVESNSFNFEGENDIEDQVAFMKGSFLINFYGENARQNAYYFTNASKSQLGYELQRDLNISMYRPKSITNLTGLEGNHFKKRYEVEVIIRYTENLNIDTLNIETTEISYLFNK